LQKSSAKSQTNFQVIQSEKQNQFFQIAQTQLQKPLAIIVNGHACETQEEHSQRFLITTQSPREMREVLVEERESLGVANGDGRSFEGIQAARSARLNSSKRRFYLYYI
jgi:hypothetical protein